MATTQARYDNKITPKYNSTSHANNEMRISKNTSQDILKTFRSILKA